MQGRGFPPKPGPMCSWHESDRAARGDQTSKRPQRAGLVGKQSDDVTGMGRPAGLLGQGDELTISEHLRPCCWAGLWREPPGGAAHGRQPASARPPKSCGIYTSP